jgi:hypothetical protein
VPLTATADEPLANVNARGSSASRMVLESDGLREVRAGSCDDGGTFIGGERQ